MADKYRFAYSAIRNIQGEVGFRPMLPLKLIHQGNSILENGLLDSGADVNVLPYRIGLELGAIWSEQTTLVRLSGNLANYEARDIIVSGVVENLPPVRLVFA